jgi:tRNA pseudouridine38-40 synthase
VARPSPPAPGLADMAESFRYILKIEYFGAPYHGWQSQVGGRTVQDAVERAIGKLKDGERRITCAGRTDAGVHALGQVAHVDLSKVWRPDKLRDALNAHLAQAGEAIAILDVASAPVGFDARLSALRRHYRYRLLNRRPPSALLRNRLWHVARPLDVATMQAAAQTILGKHDFTTFRAAACQANSPIRTLERLDVSRQGEEIHIEASARSFLHNQVRSMVGSLVKIGLGAWPASEMRAALDAADRARCGPVAPPDGLYFMAVDYPEALFAPE